MKFLYPLVPLMMFFSGLAFLFAGETQKQEQQAFKMRPTHESLLERQGKARESRAEAQKDQVSVVKAERVKKDPKSASLIKRSAIISSGRNWTIVPRGAVLHVPDQYKSRVNGERKGKLVPWKTFYSQNIGWIHTHAVSMEQARGEKPMNPKQVETYRNLSRVVVSICHGGPISVIEPPEEEGEDGEVSGPGAGAPLK